MSSGLETQLFNLKFAAKQLHRQSAKSVKQAKLEKAKLRKAIEQGNKDGARLHAENAIRHEHMAQNYLRLASRIEGASSRVETAIRLGQVTKSMSGVVSGLDKAARTMDVERIGIVMDQFEKQTENMETMSMCMEDKMSGSVTLSTPVDQVDSLINQVADQYGLDVQLKLGVTPTAVPTSAVPPSSLPATPVSTISLDDEESLLSRFAALRS